MWASQQLVLFEGIAPAQFAVQRECLQQIRNVVFKSIKNEDAPVNHEQKIHLERRVFTKASTSSVFVCV